MSNWNVQYWKWFTATLHQLVFINIKLLYLKFSKVFVETQIMPHYVFWKLSPSPNRQGDLCGLEVREVLVNRWRKWWKWKHQINEILLVHVHDDVIKWKHFPRHWPFVRRMHLSPVDSPYKGQYRRALMFSLIYAGTNGWANNLDAGDLRCHRVHYDVTVRFIKNENWFPKLSWQIQ